MRLGSAWTCIAISVALAACDGAPPPADEHERQAEEPIINGVIDTDNPAAIGFGSGNGGVALCSGTIIQVKGNQGWALTAAHCADAIRHSLVLLGNLDDAPREFPVVEVVAEKDYSNGLYWNDYAVARFLGADDTVPVVPVATVAEDNLAVGTLVTLAGYGQTESGGPSPQRRSITLPIQMLQAASFSYDQTNGGICFGDSGGPAFADLPAGRRVVGVTTAVDPTCKVWGGSARASAHRASFIQPALDMPSFASCWDCYESAIVTTTCWALLDACSTTGSPCNLYSQCVGSCPDVACQTACGTTYPQGKADLEASSSCPCGACGDLCADEPVCGGPGTGCGFVSDTPSCSACIQGCCTEAQACANDPTGCATCYPNCTANAAADALSACLQGSSCITTCGLDLVMTSSSGAGGASGAGGGATATSSTTSAASSATSGGTGGGGGGSGGSEVASGEGGGGGQVVTHPKKNGAEAPQDDGGCSVAAPLSDASSNGNAALAAAAVAAALQASRRRRRCTSEGLSGSRSFETP